QLVPRAFAGPVDAHALAPHVALPGIRAGGAAATGFLLAAEGRAHVGAGRSHVDLGDAAVAAFGRQKGLDVDEAVAVDARGEALRHAVVDRDRLLQRVVLDHVDDGREGLVLHTRPLGPRAGDDRRLDAPAGPVHALAAPRRAAPDCDG